jgi:hypothetical protein
MGNLKKISKSKKTIYFLIFVPVFVLSLYFGIQGYVIDSNLQTFTSPRQCAMDADCVPFGKTGTCGCGCYNRTYELPKIESKGLNSGLCYCSGPKVGCKCSDEGTCVYR